ncbi:hypothetical protein Q5P01_009990 [Channa striata]|uniref:Uncharacterized protein n=1 Tax=Channa striata TaxID=64152 RepID=A0AA88N273_CHASR|nr:hypothetical protein Q5P01_009990 [Channa striata]
MGNTSRAKGGVNQSKNDQTSATITTGPIGHRHPWDCLSIDMFQTVPDTSSYVKVRHHRLFDQAGEALTLSRIQMWWSQGWGPTAKPDPQVKSRLAGPAVSRGGGTVSV